MSVSDNRGYERRIGDRVEASDVTLVWRADADDQRRRWKRSPRPEIARVLDLSLTGALVLLASAADDLMVGSTVVVEVDGHRGRVRIRRIQPSSDPKQSLVGVSFLELAPELNEMVKMRVAAARAKVREGDWHNVR